MEKMQLNDDELDLVNGGDITYTWNGTSGSIGIDGKNVFKLINKDGFVTYYNSVHGKLSDAEILTNLIKKGYVKR